MDNSLLVSLSQQLAAYRSMDVIANNLANVSTPGFKRESARFEELVAMVRPADGQRGMQPVSFVKDAGISRDLGQGAITRTDAPLDVAINGNGFFVVTTPAGERYTRDGHFSLDQEGRLVTSDGHAVMGDGGAITVNPADGEIHIARDGTISSDQGQRGRLAIVSFENPQDMRNVGNTMLDTDQAEIAPENIRLMQGALEGSNVQPIVEMTNMIEVSRSYASAQKLIDQADQMRRQAIQELGTAA